MYCDILYLLLASYYCCINVYLTLYSCRIKNKASSFDLCHNQSWTHTEGRRAPKCSKGSLLLANHSVDKLAIQLVRKVGFHLRNAKSFGLVHVNVRHSVVLAA